MESVNIKKLAQILGLSISAVSKALRDSHDISKETKEKVIALATELNYQPNPYASSLRKHKSKTIAVIIPEIANNFFTLAINGIESIAQEKNYHVLIYLTHEDVNKEIALTRYLHGGRVDGVLISVSSTTTDYTHLHQLEKNGLSVVFFDRICEPFNTVKVTTDDYESSYLATRHLMEQGCKKPAHLAMSSNISIGNKRKKGYLQALADHGLRVDESLIVECVNDDERDVAMIKDLLTQQRPDGIFAAVEQYALGVYEACRQLDLSIPGDVKVICFSNMKMASYLNPSLTTITQPAFAMGKEAAAMLFKALDKKSSPLKDENIVIRSTLIARESTKA
ncbi:MAG TPA: LacI family DNA-binding transcriptional regulator [Puia sp.]|nr:LacI family DNA-binding transcriptional regulator [Puia sp.]